MIRGLLVRVSLTLTPALSLRERGKGKDIPPSTFTFDLTASGWALAAGAAFLIGLSKTGLPGIGILAVTMLAIGMGDAKVSVGAMLPLLIVGDVFAVVYWHRKAVWSIVWRIVPPAALGIIGGWLALSYMNPSLVAHVLGGIVLVLITLQLLRDCGYFSDQRIPHHWAFAWGMGGLAGFVTGISNAAGPIIIIFLLAMNLDRFRFIGTIAVYFLILNTFKVPFFAQQSIITGPSLMFNLKLAPVVLVGCVLGLFAPRFIPEKPFRWTVILLAVAAGVWLLVKG